MNVHVIYALDLRVLFTNGLLPEFATSHQVEKFSFCLAPVNFQKTRIERHALLTYVSEKFMNTKNTEINLDKINIINERPKFTYSVKEK